VLPEAERPGRNGKPEESAAASTAWKVENGRMKDARVTEYCRVIVRIREKTRKSVMAALSAAGRDNLSVLIDELLAQWLATHDAKQPTSRRKKAAR
jgi:hypothetical protein